MEVTHTKKSLPSQLIIKVTKQGLVKGKLITKAFDCDFLKQPKIAAAK